MSRQMRREPEQGQEVFDFNRLDDDITATYIGEVLSYDRDWYRVRVTYHNHVPGVGPVVLVCDDNILWDCRKDNKQFSNPRYIHLAGDAIVSEETVSYYMTDLTWSDSRRAWYVD